MSQANFEALQAEIEGIPESEIKTPNMPVEKYVQEAANLEAWIANDHSLLMGVGVANTTLTNLPIQTGALRYAQSIWTKERHTRETAQQQWETASPSALELKNQLEHSFRFAFRDRQDLLNKVHEIEEGSSNEDLVQDLSDLAVLGNGNPTLLSAINFDTNLLTIAADLSASLSSILALANGEKAEGNVSKVVRDQAYTLLKKSVDEIRSAGKYVFWKDKQKRKGYLSFNHR